MPHRHKACARSRPGFFAGLHRFIEPRLARAVVLLDHPHLEARRLCGLRGRAKHGGRRRCRAGLGDDGGQQGGGIDPAFGGDQFARHGDVAGAGGLVHQPVDIGVGLAVAQGLGEPGFAGPAAPAPRSAPVTRCNSGDDLGGGGGEIHRSAQARRGRSRPQIGEDRAGKKRGPCCPRSSSSRGTGAGRLCMIGGRSVIGAGNPAPRADAALCRRPPQAGQPQTPESRSRPLRRRGLGR